MSDITRKSFLGFAASLAGAAAAGPGQAQPAKAAPQPKGPARPILIRGADVLTMDSQGDLLRTDVLVQDGQIREIGKNIAASGAEMIDASDMILMPGMIDGHRHVWESIDMGRIVKSHPAAYAHYQEWKMRTIVCMTPEDHHLAQLVGGLQMIDTGVTSVLDFAHGQIDGERAFAAARGLKESGVGGWFAFQMGVQSSYKPGDTVPLSSAHGERIGAPNESHWRTAERLQNELFSGSSDVLQFGIAPAAGQGSRIEAIREEFGRIRGMGVKMLAAHIHRPSQPVPEGLMAHRDSGIPDLQAAGLLGPDYHVSHGNRLTLQELAMLRDSGGMICATAMGEFPYMTSPSRGPSVHARARAAGVATGIGLDVTLALNTDYFECIRAAFWNLYLEDESRKIAETYTSNDTLDFATALGAKAIRQGDKVGTVTVGKRADLVLLRTDRIGVGRGGSLADRVMTFANGVDVDSVWIAGVPRKRGGKLLGFDIAKLNAQRFAAQERIGRDAATIKFV
jgi:cytosine/adenosine deaminase-related metal-dependent hydrolase